MSSFSKSELAQLKIIENEVNSYLNSKQTNPKTAVGVNSALNRVIPMALLPTKKVTITWNDNARTPFIMSITPDISELYKKSEELTNIMSNPKSSNAEFVKKWAEIKEWHIEIDTRVLTKGNRLCVTDGAQFVALLCHEIGHVMTENPIRLISNYKLKSLDFSMLEKLMLSNSKVIRAILLPMYTHTLQFFIVVQDRNDQKQCELAADAYVPDEYKGALVSYMNDHLLIDTDASKLVVDADTFDKEQEVGIELSRDSVEMLRGRRDALNRQIQSQYNSPQSSSFQKNLMKFIGHNLMGYDPESDAYTTMSAKTAFESMYNREYDAQTKAAMVATMEAAKITPRDIDILEVQIDDIKTPEDKMYMIHKMYDYIEAVGAENAKKAKNAKKDIPDIIKDDRLERLNAMRAKILAKDVTTIGDKYGVFVKYPAGYEG
jgi:hypothetical protein